MRMWSNGNYHLLLVGTQNSTATWTHSLTIQSSACTDTSEYIPKGLKTLLLVFSHSVMSHSLWPHGLQHSRFPCPSPSPGACSNSCLLSRWCHPNIMPSVIPFSSCLQSFPASGSFLISRLLASSGQTVGASASGSDLLVNIQDWFPLGWIGWITLQPKGLSRVFSNTTVQKHQLFGIQPSSWSSFHIHTWLLERPQLWLEGLLLAK